MADKAGTMKLTDRQRQILGYIEGHIQEHGVAPTVREIGRQFNIFPRAALDHLRALERKGYIRRTPLKSRCLQVAKTHRFQDHNSGTIVPIVGRIAAGRPILAVENIEGDLVVDMNLFRKGDYFAVEVKGESMIEAHILDGDYVILRKQSTAEKGDVVAVLLDEEVTLKEFHHKGTQIELRPANREFKPLRVPADQVKILGRMVGLVRKGVGDRVTR